MSDDASYASIREILGGFIGRRVVEITQQDCSDFEETGRTEVWLHFDDGSSLTFSIGDDGFDVHEP